MVGVLRIAKISLSATDEDVKNFFRDFGAFPEDIHWSKHDGKSSRGAFLAFRTNKEIDEAMKADGAIWRGERVSVFNSSPQEFNRFFPSKSLFSKDARPRNRNQNIRGDFDNQRRFSGIERNDNYKTQLHSQGARFENTFSNNRNYIDNSRRRDDFDDKRFHSSKERNGNYNLSNNYNMPNDYSRNDFANKNFSSARENQQQSTRRSASHETHSGAYERTTANYKRNAATSKDRARSRSPVNRGNPERNFYSKTIIDSTKAQSAGFQQKKPERSTLVRQKERERSGPRSYNDVNERKFLRLTGLSYKNTTGAVKNFFSPLNAVNVHLLKFSSGPDSGKPNGSALVEFQDDQAAQKALTYDGLKMGSRTISVFRAAKDDVVAVLQDSMSNQPSGSGLLADVDTLNALATSNPEVQHLVGLLNAAVTNIAGSNVQSQRKRAVKDNLGGMQSDQRPAVKQNEDPVISRVATSANINVDDIKNGRVVAMRNLPYTVTPQLILDLFRGYHAIENSVRIHYLDNGRCSGDAIICFRGNREARIAVQDLNKKIIDNRKVELFFL